MTQSIPAQSKLLSDEAGRQQRLMELVKAEDAANGEVGCGQFGKGEAGDASTYGITLDDEKLKGLLREHLGTLLMEPDFDSITTQIQRHLESLTVQALRHSGNCSDSAPLLTSADTPEHIPTVELKELFQSQVAEFGSEEVLEPLIQFSHQVIHRAILQPRHTWPSPIWVFRGEMQIYIAQAPRIEEAIAKIKAQHPQETKQLSVITVGGILAPDQVIALEPDLLS